MTCGTPEEHDDGRAYLLEDEAVRREFRAASCDLWIKLVKLLGMRWDKNNQALARYFSTATVRILSDLAKLRCLPDGQPLSAAAVFDELNLDASIFGRTPEQEVEQLLVRRFTGEPRNARGRSEITALIQAFLRCYAADYERGELTWVDEVHAMTVPAASAVTWVLEVLPATPEEGSATVTLRLPVVALEAAGLRSGDRLIVEPRFGGLWLARAAKPPSISTT